MYSTTFNGRTINYSDTKSVEESIDMPSDNWCLILISEDGEKQLLERIINQSIDNKVGYICGIGKMHEFIHFYSDLEFTRREIEDNIDNPEYHIMTVGDLEFEEGMWFGLFLTFNPEVEINTIQIIDETCKMKKKVIRLIEKFKNGYIPEE